MQKNLHAFERVARLLFGVSMLFAAWQFFQHPLARILAAALGFYSLAECALAWCPLHRLYGVLTPADRLKPEARRLFGLLGMQAVLAYEWWTAGWEKVSSPDFVQGIGKTLGFFASKNPFPWYQSFLEGVAAPNGTAFAYAVEWSEIAVGVVLLVSAGLIVWAKREKTRRAALIVSSLAFAGGMLMNANFYLAAGWTGPGTKGENVVMFWMQALLIYIWLSSTNDRLTASSAL